MFPYNKILPSIFGYLKRIVKYFFLIENNFLEFFSAAKKIG